VPPLIVDLAATSTVHIGERYAMRLRRRSVALGATVAAIASVPLIITISADAAADVLYSQSRPAIASSSASAAFAAAKAVDGSGRTRWASAGTGTQWLRIDLGGVRPVNRVRLVWEAAYARSYQVQLSADGATWSHLWATRAGNGGTDDLRGLSGTGRYLRVLTTQAHRHGYSLWEVQVYGTARSAATVTASPGPSLPPTSAAPTSAAPTSAAPTSPAPTSTAPAPAASVPVAGPGAGLDDPVRKEIAMQLVSSAENSTLSWADQYGYIEDIGDGRGYTAGIIGFCSGTSDMLAAVSEYTRRDPTNILVKYLTPLRTVNGSDSHEGLGSDFTEDWKKAAEDPLFQQVQRDERDRLYFDPAVAAAKADGVRALGQFAYYDAAVMHGGNGMRSIRAAALRQAKSPAQGGDEVTYLYAFLDARVAQMRTEQTHSDTTRVDTAQRMFLNASNLDLDAPLAWTVYGEGFLIAG
jgi:chitosanase